jgi:DNA replication and repair protein RecF
LLRLKKIQLVQFKNYSHQGFHFDERIIGICGKNGLGKTNLLDAIYYLCFTKSYFSRSDQLNIQLGTEGFRNEGTFSKNGKQLDAVCLVKDGFRKEFQLNGVAYEKFSAHIGLLPAVMIAPDDIEMITGGSEERRRYLDSLLSQLDTDYLQALIEYNKVLQQRNSYLKLTAAILQPDLHLLDVYDAQLIKTGNLIFSRRKHYLELIMPAVKSFYSRIAGLSESMELAYESQLTNESLASLLLESRDRDIYTQRTQVGTHRDNIAITLHGEAFRFIASQGQRKSLLFAFKLAEFMLLKDIKGFSPILLLDDVFEKLDDSRMHNLLHWVCVENDGQIFITDTHKERIRQKMQEFQISYQLIEL